MSLYPNILPGKSAILLNDSTIVNANFISDPFDQTSRIIAAMTPSISEINNFWRMIYENRVSTIVMLTKFIEKYKIMAYNYLPTDIDVPEQFGDLIITIYNRKKIKNTILSRLTIQNKTDVFNILHIHYLDWQDMDVPKNTDDILSIVDMCRGTIIVHCSAGIGRTGTFIALMQLIQHENYPEDYDSKKRIILSNMREIRPEKIDQSTPQMVCTIYQEQFIDYAYNYYIDNKKLTIYSKSLSTLVTV